MFLEITRDRPLELNAKLNEQNTPAHEKRAVGRDSPASDQRALPAEAVTTRAENYINAFDNQVKSLSLTGSAPEGKIAVSGSRKQARPHPPSVI